MQLIECNLDAPNMLGSVQDGPKRDLWVKWADVAFSCIAGEGATSSLSWSDRAHTWIVFALRKLQDDSREVWCPLYWLSNLSPYFHADFAFS